jgi:hypothetical protein
MRSPTLLFQQSTIVLHSDLLSWTGVNESKNKGRELKLTFHRRCTLQQSEKINKNKMIQGSLPSNPDKLLLRKTRFRFSTPYLVENLLGSSLRRFASFYTLVRKHSNFFCLRTHFSATGMKILLSQSQTT